jgi:hypothetical protein
MNIKKYFFLLFLIVISASDLYSGDYPFQFLRYISTARASALGGAFDAIVNDPNALFYNPASVYTVKEKRFSASFLKHTLDINSGNISFSNYINRVGVVALSAAFSNYGSFQRANNIGTQIGSFSANDMSLSVSYANELDTNLFYGGSLKYIYENIDKYSSSAMALDVGILYKLKDGRTNLGASILNVGTQLSSFNGTSESLPLDIRLGVNHRLKGLPLMVLASFHHLADKSDNFFGKFLNFSLGGELYVGQYVRVRLGYDNQIRSEAAPSGDKKLSGLSGGIGILAKFFNFDYSISQVGSAALLQRFSLSLDI